MKRIFNVLTALLLAAIHASAQRPPAIISPEVLTYGKIRAIAGFSVGGGQTLNIGLTKFPYVCSYVPLYGNGRIQKQFR
jgi:S-formylglutathione hydrolase FrmB